MPILFLLFALLVPRLVIAILWFFTGWFTAIFSGLLIPVLGFIFTPYTLIWYTVVQHYFNGVFDFWQVVFLVIAILFDLAQLMGRKG